MNICFSTEQKNLFCEFTCEYDLRELVVAHIEVADLRAVIAFA